MFNISSHQQSNYNRIIILSALVAVLSLTTTIQARAQTLTKNDFTFLNAVDSTQGYSSFGFAPAINNAGAVAFQSPGNGLELGGVWKWQNGRLMPIATSKDNILGSFGDNVVINSAGRVGFNVKVLATNDTIIATGDGGELNTIVSAQKQALIGGPFLGISAMNESGTVVFLGVRSGSGSRAIFTGRGGPLTAVIDTADSNFSGLGNSAIDASGRVVFLGFMGDGSEGVFLSDRGIQDITDTNNGAFFDFLDPVINDSGTVGGAAFLNAGGEEVFTATPREFTPRTNPNSTLLTFVDNVSLNNLGDVAFLGEETMGQGIFVELTGGTFAVPVIETGDELFGSTVVGLSTGRFSLNDNEQIAFQYRLANGRSGIAVASRQ